LRAGDRSTACRGAHGLPLIGGGDWNDGMNRVGEAGKGESVWLAFFVCEVLTRFAEVARLQDDETFAQTLRDEVAKLRRALEQPRLGRRLVSPRLLRRRHAAGFHRQRRVPDRLDRAELVGALRHGRRERQQQAMDSLDRHLVRRDARLVQLLDPPFDKSPLDPGYIKGYVPGVRENGGQYTHAAIWATMAFAGQRRQRAGVGTAAT
jgi:cyclic beta-1,2-glucan synthetase